MQRASPMRIVMMIKMMRNKQMHKLRKKQLKLPPVFHSTSIWFSWKTCEKNCMKAKNVARSTWCHFLSKWKILLLKSATNVLSMQNRNKKRHYESKKQMELLNTNYNNKLTRKLMATVLTYLNKQHCISWKWKDDSFYLKERKDVLFYLKVKRCSILLRTLLYLIV